MLKASSAEVKQMSKNRLSGNWGNAIIAVFIPILIGIVVGFIIGLVLMFFPFVSSIATIVIGAVTSFMTFRMVIPFVKGKDDVDFGNSLSPGNWLVQFVLFAIITFVISLVVNIPVNLAFFGEAFVFEGAEVTIGETTELNAELFSITFYTLVTAVVMFIITLKLYFTNYLIADKGMNAIEAMKKSWQLTNGNFGRLVYYELSWIGWYLLSILTCGILLFYVLPYHTFASAYLYLEVLDENGESDYNPHRKDDHHLQGDWIEVEQDPRAQQHEEQENDSWDF